MTSQLIEFRSSFAFRVGLSLGVGLFAAIALSGDCQGQELPPLTDDEKSAIEKIVEQDVVGNLTFLASDELKGRGTGTEGLQVANAYVASRFRALGLVGPDKADEDDFYQTHEIDMISTPSAGIAVWDKDGNTLANHGVFTNSEEAFLFEGELGTFDSANEADKEKKFDGPVFVNPAKILEGRSAENGQMASRQLANAARKVAKQGATALIVPVKADSPVAKFAMAQMDAKRMSNPRRSVGIPVLLVDAKTTADSIAKISLPAVQKVKQPVANVVGVLPGSDKEMKDEAIIFSAHLDHLGSRDSGNEDGIYNGADDNASGVTGVLALAKAYAALPEAPKRTMIFVAFWGEERGLLGSRYMVENPIWPLDKTVANINLEMIGRPEAGANGKIWMTGWDQSDLGQLMNLGSQRIEIDIFEHPQFSNRLYRASDNWSFVAGGVVAHSFSAGSLHSDYHQPSDEWQKLNTRHMTIVCKGLFAGSLPLANGEVTPKGKDDDRE